MRALIDQRGRFLGDDPLPPDLQSFVDQSADPATGIADPTAPIGSAANPLQLPTMTVSVAPASFSLQQLLKPPYLYWVMAGVALFAYLNKGK